MSSIQQKAVDYILKMSDEDVELLLNLFSRMMPSIPFRSQEPTKEEREHAFRELERLKGGFPKNFDPEKELMDALEEKYGRID